MPSLSLTAILKRCLQPMYRSVVCTETSEKELNLLKLAARIVAEPRAGPSKIVRR
jgi:hypothetical protein